MLKRLPLFANLERQEMDTVAACLLLRYVQSGDTIYAPGDPGDAMYFVESGQVEIIAGELRLAARWHASYRVIISARWRC